MKLRARWRGLRLNAKFTAVIVLLVWVPVIAFAAFFFNSTQESLMQEACSSMELELQDTSTQLAAYVDSVNMSTQLFLSDTSLIDFLEKVSSGVEMTTKEILTFYNETVTTQERLIYNNLYLYQIRVYADSDTMQEMMPTIYRKNRMEKLAWAQEDETQWEGWHYDYEDLLFASEGEGKRIASYVTRIQSYGYGEIGILEVAISMDTLFTDLYGQTEEKWHCFISDDGICCLGDADDETRQALVKKILPEVLEISEEMAGSYQITAVSLETGQALVGSFYSNGLSGIWLSVYDLNTVTADLNLIRTIAFVLIAILLLLLTWVINRIVNGLLKGFYNVLGTVREVQKGDLDARVTLTGYDWEEGRFVRKRHPSSQRGQGLHFASDEGGGTDAQPMVLDETGELAEQINRMLDHINTLMEENIRREVLTKNAEIKSLQNQINAHFIYNVLESIKMMAEIEEKYEISDAVTQLGQLLRYNLYWTSGTVTVREEIEYIRNYIALMNLRFDYEIYLSENLPDIVLAQKIPKMTLQPIVENSIYHGIEQMAEDTNIYVKGFLQEGDCIIELTDAGNGMSEERLLWLQEIIAGSDALGKMESGLGEDSSGKGEADPGESISRKDHSGSGIGLKNVQDRIRLTFGSSYGIQVASREGCYTKVRIRIPIEAR
ncbi:MAG: sensor histidine kinase [Lachnospiraceae bacterium]|nr:sensor histidine kinase [Lachnospiraceae bacterium]